MSGSQTIARRPRIPRERPRLTGRAAVLLVVLLVLAFMAAVPARQYLGERSRIDELERRATELEEQNAGLRAQISKLDDPVELERLARACLGMVLPGEVVFVTPGGLPSIDAC